jgi:hypothetical protein
MISLGNASTLISSGAGTSAVVSDFSDGSLSSNLLSGAGSGVTTSDSTLVGFFFWKRLKPHLPMSEVIPTTLSNGLPVSFWIEGRAA